MIFGPKMYVKKLAFVNGEPNKSNSFDSGIWSSASAWLPLLYDTVVVVLVMARTRDLFRVRIVGQYRVVETLMKDGLMYYRLII